MFTSQSKIISYYEIFRFQIPPPPQTFDYLPSMTERPYHVQTWWALTEEIVVLFVQLCRNALTWAKTLAKDDKFMHQPDNPFGENLFSIWSSNLVTAKDAICNWYKEGKNYDYSKEPRILKSGNNPHRMIFFVKLQMLVTFEYFRGCYCKGFFKQNFKHTAKQICVIIAVEFRVIAKSHVAK